MEDQILTIRINQDKEYSLKANGSTLDIGNVSTGKKKKKSVIPKINIKDDLISQQYGEIGFDGEKKQFYFEIVEEHFSQNLFVQNKVNSIKLQNGFSYYFLDSNVGFTVNSVQEYLNYTLFTREKGQIKLFDSVQADELKGVLNLQIEEGRIQFVQGEQLSQTYVDSEGILHISQKRKLWVNSNNDDVLKQYIENSCRYLVAKNCVIDFILPSDQLEESEQEEENPEEQQQQLQQQQIEESEQITEKKVEEEQTPGVEEYEEQQVEQVQEQEQVTEEQQVTEKEDIQQQQQQDGSEELDQLRQQFQESQVQVQGFQKEIKEKLVQIQEFQHQLKEKESEIQELKQQTENKEKELKLEQSKGESLLKQKDEDLKILKSEIQVLLGEKETLEKKLQKQLQEFTSENEKLSQEMQETEHKLQQEVEKNVQLQKQNNEILAKQNEMQTSIDEFEVLKKGSNQDQSNDALDNHIKELKQQISQYQEREKQWGSETQKTASELKTQIENKNKELDQRQKENEKQIEELKTEVAKYKHLADNARSEQQQETQVAHPNQKLSSSGFSGSLSSNSDSNDSITLNLKIRKIQLYSILAGMGGLLSFMVFKKKK